MKIVFIIIDRQFFWVPARESRIPSSPARKGRFDSSLMMVASSSADSWRYPPVFFSNSAVSVSRGTAPAQSRRSVPTSHNRYGARYQDSEPEPL